MGNEEIELKGKRASSMEDLIELAGVSGPWSWMILAICSTGAFTYALQSLNYQFLGVTPDHWCQVGPLIEANWTQEQILDLAIPVNAETNERESCQMYDYNYTLAADLGFNYSVNDQSLLSSGNKSIIACSARYFNSSDGQSTVVTQWDLVCERRPLYSTVQGITQSGYIVGSLIFGHLLDAFGRRPICLSCIALTVVLKFVAIFSPNVLFYIIVRGFSSICIMGIFTANFVIVMESCSPRQRSTVATLFVIPWAIGYMVLPGIAYCVPNWKMLHIVLSLPFCGLLILFWLLPESPRWLLLHGRYREALKVLTMAARINHQLLPSESTILDAMEKVAQQELASTESTAQLDLKSRILRTAKSIFSLMVDPHYRSRMMLLLFGWFSCAMVYYGISLSATNLSANLYIYIFLGGLLEVPVYLLMWLWLSFRGRRNLLATLLLVCAICIALLSIILVFVPDAPVTVKATLSLCGKFSITAAFQLIWIYTAELFPTEYRSQAIGQGNVLGRIGSTCAPYINDILGEVTTWAPSMMYASLSLVAAAITLLLPDSKGRNLPETNKCQEDKAKTDE